MHKNSPFLRSSELTVPLLLPAAIQFSAQVSTLVAPGRACGKILNSATTSIDAIYMYVYMYMYILCKYWATVCSVVLSVDKVKRNSQSSSKHEMFLSMHASALLDPTTHDLDVRFISSMSMHPLFLFNQLYLYLLFLYFLQL